MPGLTFGITLRGSPSASAFRDVVTRAESLGCDVLAAPDHLGCPDPFAVLNSAAQITRRMRLRTYVLNAGFWNPALLARAASTTDLLSEGRLELGLGAGHMRDEYEDAGLPWQDHRDRVDRMERTLDEVRERLSDSDHKPRAVQRPIPVVIGAMSTPGLSVAARNADVVAFSGIVPDAAGTPVLASAAQTRKRADQVRDLAKGRRHQCDALLQVIRLGADPGVAAEKLAAEWGDTTAEQLLDSPFVLLARDAAHGLEILAQRREDFGFDSFITHEPNLDALGQILAAG